MVVVGVEIGVGVAVGVEVGVINDYHYSNTSMWHHNHAVLSLLRPATPALPHAQKMSCRRAREPGAAGGGRRGTEGLPERAEPSLQSVSEAQPGANGARAAAPVVPALAITNGSALPQAAADHHVAGLQASRLSKSTGGFHHVKIREVSKRRP